MYFLETKIVKLSLILLLLILPITVFAQQDDLIENEASEDVITLPPVVKIEERIERKQRHTLGGTSITSAVGSGGDPLRALDELPSVGTLNDFVGILSVRGGDPEDNIYYFDRLPLGYPYHLYGIVSTVNADVLQKIDVYPGGYGGQYGANSQAVIDIHSRGNTDKRVVGKLNLNPVYSQSFFEGSIGGNRGYWYIFGRRSFMGPLFELLPILLEVDDDLVTEVPRFWSYQGKAVYQLSKDNRVVVNAIAADDSAKFRFTEDEVSDSDLCGPLNSENPFDSQGIHFHSEKEETFSSVVSLTRSFSRTQLEYGDGYIYKDSDSVYSLRGDLQYWVEFPMTLIESGFDVSSVPSNLTSIGARPLEEGDWDFDFRLKQDGEKVHTTSSKILHRFEGYLQGTQDLFSARYVDLFGTVGLRTTYYNLIDSFYIQPRGQFGLTLGHQRKTAYGLSLLPIDLRFMSGKYVQNPQLYQVVFGNDNPDISPSNATHYVLSIEKRLTAETRIEVAGYYKNLQDMITFNLAEKRYENQRTGSVRGIEFSLEHEIGDVFRGWLAYSYTLSRRRDSHKEKERDFMYSTPHVMSVGLNYTFASLEFGATWQYKSGILYAPLADRERYTNPFTKNETWIPVYGDLARAAPYHRLDLRIHWSVLRINRFKCGFTAEIWNAYNRTNILQVRYNENYTKEVQIAQLPLIPFLAFTVEY